MSRAAEAAAEIPVIAPAYAPAPTAEAAAAEAVAVQARAACLTSGLSTLLELPYYHEPRLAYNVALITDADKWTINLHTEKLKLVSEVLAAEATRKIHAGPQKRGYAVLAPQCTKSTLLFLLWSPVHTTAHCPAEPNIETIHDVWQAAERYQVTAAFPLLEKRLVQIAINSPWEVLALGDRLDFEIAAVIGLQHIARQEAPPPNVLHISEAACIRAFKYQFAAQDALEGAVISRHASGRIDMPSLTPEFAALLSDTLLVVGPHCNHACDRTLVFGEGGLAIALHKWAADALFELQHNLDAFPGLHSTSQGSSIFIRAGAGHYPPKCAEAFYKDTDTVLVALEAHVSTILNTVNVDL